MDTGKPWLFAPVLLATLATARARANGAFPAVSQLVADPSEPAHLVLRSNFGILSTRDRGEHWDLVCEGGVGYQNIEPAIAVLENGTTIAALPQGIAYSASAECNFEIANGVASYIADVARVPGEPEQAVAVSVDVNSNESRVWRTADGGRSWQAASAALSDLNAATLDVASADPSTLYVSGIAQSAGVSGVLSRSSDAGKTWARFSVPGASKVSAPYIAAVADTETVYVRLSGSPGHLLVTHDGGQHFQTLLDFQGPFDGFALSPDGKLALASGRVDGVWRASTTSLRFERLSCAKLRCLSWTAAGLFACANDFEAGFLVGESSDLGRSFEARLHLSCVRGPLACPSGSSVGDVCPAAWPAISEQLGTDCASAGSFMPSSSCASESGDAATDAGASGTVAAAGDGGNLQPHGGCALGHPHSTPRAGSWPLAALAVLLRRRSARAVKTQPALGDGD
jgi:hypothetical protein